MAAASAATPTPAPMPACAAVERPPLLGTGVVVGETEVVGDVVDEAMLLVELVVAEGSILVCMPCALMKTPCSC